MYMQYFVICTPHSTTQTIQNPFSFPFFFLLSSVWYSRINEARSGRSTGSMMRREGEEAETGGWSRINFHHLCSSCCLVRWCKGGWTRRTMMLWSRGSGTIRGCAGRFGSVPCVWLEGCFKAGTYLCRWCHCPRSPVYRYTGVLWWCWCRWHSHHTNFARWRTHHALRER